MTREDDIREVLDETAQAFKQYDSNPSAWLSWIIYLLTSLQQLSMDVNPMHQEVYEDMLATLQDAIRNRLRRGGW